MSPQRAPTCRLVVVLLNGLVAALCLTLDWRVGQDHTPRAAAAHRTSCT